MPCSALVSPPTRLQTPGVDKHAHFIKEIPDAQNIRTKIMDNIETAYLPGQTEEEQRRLLHTVVVGGGPTGIEFAAELRDFLLVSLDFAIVINGIQSTLRITTFGGASEKCPYSRSVLISEVPFECM